MICFLSYDLSKLLTILDAIYVHDKKLTPTHKIKDRDK